MISQTINVVVTSVRQTTAGKMTVGRYVDAGSGLPVSGGSSMPSQEGAEGVRRLGVAPPA